MAKRPLEERTTVDFSDDPGRTQTQFKDDCDVNKIVERHTRLGVVEHVNRHQPRYGDVTGVDFRAWQEKIIGVRAMFLELPAEVRARFNNAPEEFLDYVQDPNNGEELVRLGLATPRKHPVEQGDEVEKLSGDPIKTGESQRSEAEQ